MDLKYYRWIMHVTRNGVCDETGKEIKIGDKIVYLPAVKRHNIPARIFCEQSKFYKESENHIDTGWKI